MEKYFIKVDGKSYLCDEKGLIKSTEPLENTEGMEEVELEDEGTLEEVKALLSDAMAKTKSEFAKEAKEVKEEMKSFVTTLKDAFAEGKTAIKGVGDTEAKDAFATFKAKAESFLKGESKALIHEFTSKELDAIEKSVSESGSLTGDVILPQRDETLDRNPVRNVFLESIANTFPVSSNKVEWVEVVNESGAPATTAELALIPQKDWTFKLENTSLIKIAVANKHSKEILTDAPRLINAIKNWLREDVLIKTEDELLNGAGGGNNLTGIFNVASAFDAQGRSYPNANVFDVVRVAVTQILNAGKGKFFPNFILMSYTDAEKLDLQKDKNGQYLLPPFTADNGTVIKGVRVLMSSAIAEGDFLVGDFSKLNIGYQGGVTLETTDSDGTDFMHDIVTVKLTRRILSYVRANDNGAFVAGDWDSALAEITESAS